MKKVFDVILLSALPASGKSEVRNLLSNIGSKTLMEEYHIGGNLQLDDFPYVFMMRQIDACLLDINEKPIFYSDLGPFINPNDWCTLIHLLNEDYHDLISHNDIKVSSATKWMLDRIDKASILAGIGPRINKLSKSTIDYLTQRLEGECQALLEDKLNGYTSDLSNKTIIVEMSRGGKIDSEMPLVHPYGYEHSFEALDEDFLAHSSVLYIYVTPEESRRKNIERSKPNDEGSILHHSVPEAVMINDYGCDDINYLLSVSDIKDTIIINKNGKKYHLPVGVFDNRVDQTSFLREDPKSWDKDKLFAVQKSVKQALDDMWKNYQ